VLDVGGAAGAYLLWVASLGYEVHLLDTATRLVDEAPADALESVSCRRMSKRWANRLVGCVSRFPANCGFRI
jgi:hypothetical protein